MMICVERFKDESILTTCRADSVTVEAFFKQIIECGKKITECETLQYIAFLILFILQFRYSYHLFRCWYFLEFSPGPSSGVIFFTSPLGDFIHYMYLFIIHTVKTGSLMLQSRCFSF